MYQLLHNKLPHRLSGLKQLDLLFSQDYVGWLGRGAELAWAPSADGSSMGWAQLRRCHTWSSLRVVSRASTQPLPSTIAYSSCHGNWIPRAKAENCYLPSDMPGVRNPRMSFLRHIIGQSKLYGQPRFKGKGNGLRLLLGGVAESLCKGTWNAEKHNSLGAIFNNRTAEMSPLCSSCVIQRTRRGGPSGYLIISWTLSYSSVHDCFPCYTLGCPRHTWRRQGFKETVWKNSFP